MNSIKGYATQSKTKPSKNSLGRAFESRRRILYKNGPYVSPVGFGSYRIGMSPQLGFPECAQALELALQKGLNLIDTSTNYGFGQSEILIGKTIRKYVTDNKIERENLVVVSKVGYIQGPNIELAKSRELQKKPFPEISQFGDETWHCIHPDFIEDQIERSLSRLGLTCIDVYLLHNPEYMLKRFELDGVERLHAKQIFYDRIKNSFLALEKLVSAGKIKAYGVSSNNLGAPEEEFCSVSIKALHEVALSISDTHSFKVVQMPMNWLEVSPVFYEVESIGESTLSYASHHDIGVMLNRPFNAMFNDGLIRLTRPQVLPEELKNLDEGMKKGLANWQQMSMDLEKLAREQLADVPGYDDATLSQFVVSTLIWSKGVTSVLCGIRKEKYVEDVEQALCRPSLPRAREHLRGIFENLEFHV